MINLLSNETKRQFKAARTNEVLVRFLLLLAASCLFLTLIFCGAYMILSSSKSDAEKITLNNTQSVSNSFLSTNNQISELNSKFSNVQSILNEKISYSDIITGFASALPSGVVVESMTLDNTSFGKPVTIKAHAKNNEVISTIKASLDNSKIFSNCSIGSMTNDQNDKTGYPVAVNIEVTVNRNF